MPSHSKHAFSFSPLQSLILFHVFTCMHRLKHGGCGEGIVCSKHQSWHARFSRCDVFGSSWGLFQELCTRAAPAASAPLQGHSAAGVAAGAGLRPRLSAGLRAQDRERKVSRVGQGSTGQNQLKGRSCAILAWLGEGLGEGEREGEGLSSDCTQQG